RTAPLRCKRQLLDAPERPRYTSLMTRACFNSSSNAFFLWEAKMADTHNESRGGPGVSRRSFLVMLGEAVLGTYFLPQLSAVAAETPSSAAVAPAAEVVRRILTKPTKTKIARGRYLVTWVDGKATRKRLKGTRYFLT